MDVNTDMGQHSIHTVSSFQATMEPQNLRSLFVAAKSEKSTLDSRPSSDSDLNAAISKLKQCHHLVEIASLFSPNESLEEIATGDLQ